MLSEAGSREPGAWSEVGEWEMAAKLRMRSREEVEDNHLHVPNKYHAHVYYSIYCNSSS